MDNENIKQLDNRTIHNFTFHGSGGEYFKIWIVNILLSIITLGIYSAWAKVRNKRYFYGNTYLNKASFEYTALPMQILKGRIIAVLALFAVNLISQFAPTVGSILFLIIFLAMPWIVMKALAFNARNSRYKNIHFNFAQDFKATAKVFILGPIMYVFTFGLGFPLWQYWLKKYLVSNHLFGKSKFQFHLDKSGPFYGVYIIAFLLFIVVGMSFFFIAMLMGGLTLTSNSSTTSLISTVAIMVFYFFVIAYIRSQIYNITYQHTSIDGHKFSANMPVWGLAKLYFINTVGIILTLGLFIPWAMVRSAQFRARYTEMQTTVDLDNFIADKIEKQNALGEELGEQFGDSLDIDLGI